jgi:transposase
MDETARSFREHVATFRGARRRCRYPDELRQEALAYVEAARARGGTLADAAAALGVDKSVLASWRAPRQVPAMRAVKVVEGPRAAVGTGIVVHGPGGIRVEGLDLAGLATLMRSLS